MSGGAAGELDPTRLSALLRTQRFGRSLEWLAETDSTNDDARKAGAQGVPDGHTIVADAQRAGRGARGHQWTSPPGTDLYLSIVARPELPLAALPPLTLAVGLGVADAVEQLLPPPPVLRTAVKWPNDVWLNGKKCAGILIETTSSGAEVGQVGGRATTVVIGIGLNVNRLAFEGKLADTATSLRAARADGQPLDRGIALCQLLAAVEGWVDRFVAEGGDAIAAALESRLAMRGERVRCADAEGVLVGVARSGALRIATPNGIREVLAGRIVRVT